MPHAFDPGYKAEPLRTLCQEYPGAEAYPPSRFRLGWGPIYGSGANLESRC